MYSVGRRTASLLWYILTELHPRWGNSAGSASPLRRSPQAASANTVSLIERGTRWADSHPCPPCGTPVAKNRG